jgi:hypothetical protein
MARMMASSSGRSIVLKRVIKLKHTLINSFSPEESRRDGRKDDAACVDFSRTLQPDPASRDASESRSIGLYLAASSPVN